MPNTYDQPKSNRKTWKCNKMESGLSWYRNSLGYAHYRYTCNKCWKILVHRCLHSVKPAITTYIIECSHQHKNNGSRSKNGGGKDQSLVEHVKSWDVVVDFHSSSPWEEQIENVSHGRRSPSTTLVEKLMECLRCVSQRVSSCHILNSVTLQWENHSITLYMITFTSGWPLKTLLSPALSVLCGKQFLTVGSWILCSSYICCYEKAAVRQLQWNNNPCFTANQSIVD